MSTLLTTIRKHRHIVLLLVLFFIASAGRFIISWPVQWTNIPDEAWYASSANSFFTSFQLLIGGRFNSFSLPLYSVFISPAYFFGDMEYTFIAIKLINSFVMSSAMFPVFLLARRFMPFQWALIVSLLSVSIGPMFYTFRIMAESLHYPLIMWIFYLMYMSLIRDNKGTDVILGIVFGLACLNKMSSVAILLSYPILMVINSKEARNVRFFKRSPIICLRALLRYRYVFIAFAITVLPYMLCRAIETKNTDVVPYGHRWQLFIFNITHFDIIIYLKWFLMYLGQLNLSAGLFLLPASIAMVVLLWKSDRREERVFALFSVVVMVCVLSLAVLQSGYNLHRMTERHFFVLTPLVFILAVLWFLGPKKRISEIWRGVICITAIIVSWCALFLSSKTCWPAVDSALFDSLQFAKAQGLSDLGLKIIVLIISSFLILFPRFVSNRWMIRITVAVVFLFMIAITVPTYYQATRHLQYLKKTRWPIVQWLSDCIPCPANLVFLGLPRRFATDYIIWNRDSDSKILWQARERLEYPVESEYYDLLRLKRTLNEENPTYFISPFFGYSGADLISSRDGIDLYKKNDSEDTEIRQFSLDFGVKYYTRDVFRKGWGGNEGPYPSGDWPTFVWAVGRQCGLDIPTGSLPFDKILSFRAKSIICDQSINIIINGSDICTIDAQQEWQEYKLPIAAKYLRAGKNSLIFNFKYAKSPSESGGRDTRKLAVAFDWLKLEDAATLEWLKTIE